MIVKMHTASLGDSEARELRELQRVAGLLASRDHPLPFLKLEELEKERGEIIYNATDDVYIPIAVKSKP